MQPASEHGPGWLPWTIFVLSLTGTAIAAYLTYEHFSAGATLACPGTGVVNCVKVTTSQYSKLLGIPVALLGLGFFLSMSALSVPAVWRTSSPWPNRLRLAAVTIGVAFICYLLWAELFRIDAICLWCTVVHAITVALFALVTLRQAFPPIED